MKYFVAFLFVAVALGVASAGFIGGGHGWTPSYSYRPVVSRVVYAPAYGGYGGYGGWNNGWSGYGGWNRGWSRGYGGGWW